MDNQQPIIDPHMKDYTLENKKSGTIKVAIILTVALILVIGFLAYSMTTKLGTASHIGDGDIIETDTTTKKVEESLIKSTLNEYKNVYIIDITNTSSSTVDLSLAFNTYNNSELEDTFNKELHAIGSGESSAFVIRKEELKIYDSVDYKITSIKSLKNSLINDNIEFTKTNNTDDSIIFEVSNNTGKTIDGLSIVTYFYSGNTIVDAKVSSTIALESTTTFTVKKPLINYDSVSTKVIEAYYFK